MKADLEDVREDNEVSITIRRGSTTLAAQSVRIANLGTGAGRRDSAGAQESRGDVVVMGPTTFDVQVDDRFTSGGRLYRVKLVRPNVKAAVMAEAEVVQ
jgi:hypothetical protein